MPALGSPAGLHAPTQRAGAQRATAAEHLTLVTASKPNCSFQCWGPSRGSMRAPVAVRERPGQQPRAAQHGQQRHGRDQHGRQQLQAHRQPLRRRHACKPKQGTFRTQHAHNVPGMVNLCPVHAQKNCSHMPPDMRIYTYPVVLRALCMAMGSKQHMTCAHCACNSQKCLGCQSRHLRRRPG